MSTLSIWTKGPRALIATDTAGLDGDGVVRCWISKVITVPHLRMAVTTRGSIHALPGFTSDLMEACPSFDDVVAHGAEILAEAHDRRMMGLADLSGCGEFDLAVVGWSAARRRCEAHAISSMDHDGLPAFTFLYQPVLFAPAPTPADLKAAGLVVNGIIPDTNPEATVLGLIELQRCHPVSLSWAEGAPEHFIVGGQVVFTEITETGISQRIARTWPDRIGERITPEPMRTSHPVSPPAAGMSRQQRRAAEAQARKARPERVSA